VDFYDIVSETCSVDGKLAERLGLKKIFVLNKDVRAVGADNSQNRNVDDGIAFGRDQNQLLNLVKRGAVAVAITDSYVDKKLLNEIKERGCILLMPMTAITASYGLQRSHNIYKMAKLFSAARKMGIDVCFASMAKTPIYMNSYIQLIELAKLVGADDTYARYSLSKVTKSVVEA
jgi:hypothetical protein